MATDRKLHDHLVLQTERLLLRVLDDQAAAAVLDYYVSNRAFHDPWFPARDDSCFTIRQQQINLAAEKADFVAGRAVPFWLSRHEEPDRIIGRIAFTQIIYGGLRSAFMAWHLDQAFQRQGLAAEASQAAICRMFEDFNLHRLEAVIQPGNSRSIDLAKRLDFELEGVSPRYLQINGVWEDHLRYVRLSDGPLWPDKSLT